jgi:hypothetical protein
VPVRRRFVDRSASSAVFVHFGFDKFGHLPYDVFVLALTESPSRLLGHELLLNKTLGGKNGIENLVDVAYLVGDAKVDYPKSTMVRPRLVDLHVVCFYSFIKHLCAWNYRLC